VLSELKVIIRERSGETKLATSQFPKVSVFSSAFDDFGNVKLGTLTK